ncbi:MULTISPECIES: GGDEF domain-containing protein [Rhodococcus]|jgi:diguanylate cyclase (GGDEF)-like protein|uniref:GGDEF domain-containing protein n=2 Tax=Rhodococcus qingshengii TaxID=334542 RepID=A0A069JG34_RHOSG|nr:MULTISPECIES: GGDEF domain-containing protein [Rhodococcus]KLN72611.1 diguanylate cyclase [Rhodococcus erythropolis]ANQ70768.1 diguanylate cyclase [Rhodococcus sp. 008]ARE36433.1 diguanylate cyclase [Rhodococcus sp. BH4]AZI64473.1 GGDEF domain-containing protein [Rhodococcus sp. NJ-530]KDQ04089.1 diguanylate cyclase [Rhodococcus qingshengii]
MNGLVDVVMRWWQLPDQFHSFSRYLQDRGFLTSCRALVGGTAFWMGLVLLSARFSDVGPQGTFWRAVNLAVIALCLGAALIWWLFPPTPLWSYTFVVGSDVAIAAAAATDSEPLGRLIACVVFASIGGYIAFFHNPKLQVGHLVFASTVTVLSGWTLLFGPAADVGLGLAKISVVLATIIVIPVVSQIVLAVLGSDATTSDIDPLTGLLNRRGLARRVNDLMGAPVTEADALLVVVIDLDRFKTINDVHGHDVGDSTIMRTALRIRLWTTQSALTARMGGDEFVVVERVPVSVISRLEGQIRSAMDGANDDPPTSASIGMAVRTAPRNPGESVDAAFAELFRVADSVMYEAKREGGNQVRASLV